MALGLAAREDAAGDETVQVARAGGVAVDERAHGLVAAGRRVGVGHRRGYGPHGRESAGRGRGTTRVGGGVDGAAARCEHA